MASVNFSIGVSENVSSALKRMTAAVENLDNVLSSVDSRFRKAFTTKGIKAVENELAKEVQLTKLQASQVENLNRSINKSQRQTNKLKAEDTKLSRVIGSLGAERAHIGQKIKKINADIAVTESQIALRKDRLARIDRLIEKAKAKQKVNVSRLNNLYNQQEHCTNLIARDEAAIGLYNSTVLKHKRGIEKVNQKLGDSNRRRREITQELIDCEKNREHLANRISNIYSIAAKNQAKLASQQANQVAKARNAFATANAAKDKAIQKDKEQLRIQQAISSTRDRHSKALSIVNSKYNTACNLLSKLKSTADLNNKAEVKQLNAAQSLCNVRRKILNLTHNLVNARSRLSALDAQGNTKSLQFYRAKLAERSIRQQICQQASKALNLERQTLPPIKANTNAQRQFNDTVRKGGSAVDGLSSKIRSMVGAYVGVRSAGSLITTADSLAANDARLQLMVKEGESATELSDQIYAAAMRSRSGYMEMADAVAKVGIQAGNLFDNSGDMVRFMETFNKMAVISKSTTQQTNAAMTQLIQALSFGQLRGDELKSILENMPMVAQAIADEMTRMGDWGVVTADKIRELGYDGEIAAQTVVNAMLNGSKKMDDMASNMTWTWGQVWTVFKNSALRAFTPILNGISKIIQTERFQRFATWIDHVMTRIAAMCKTLWDAAGPVVAKIFDWISKIGGFIKDNWSFIAPIILGIVGAFIAYKAAMMAVVTWTAICAAANTALTVSKVIGVFVTKGITAVTSRYAKAQLGLNASLFACPITWIILAIIALIVVIYLVVAAINKLCDKTYSATGIILGCIMWVWELICNICKGVVNIAWGVIQWVVEAWKWCSDNMGTIFHNIGVWWDNLWIDAAVGFNDFIKWVLQKISSLASAIQPLADVLDIDVSAAINNHSAALDRTSALLKNGRGEYRELTEFGNVNWEQFEYGSLSGAYNRGYKLGEGISDKVEGFFNTGKLGDVANSVNDPANAAGDFTKALTGGFNNPAADDYAARTAQNTADIAKNTGATADNTSRDNDEYFKYLRQMADRNSMNRNQLMNFKVDMSNVNHIRSGIDANEMMRRLARELYHEIVGKLDGAEAY